MKTVTTTTFQILKNRFSEWQVCSNVLNFIMQFPHMGDQQIVFDPTFRIFDISLFLSLLPSLLLYMLTLFPRY